MTMTKSTSPKLQLLEMLQYKRPAGSRSERKFINRFIRPLGVSQDACGNLIKTVGPDAPTVLWSSHTDTVHRHGGRQSLTVISDIVKAPASDCLGADCTTGVWLMVNMIERGIPGLYVFHRMEEVGGIGSSHIAKETPELLDGIKYAIAFDRYGTTSVITHQGHRCASDAFADSLISQLGRKWERDTGGTFTDTANYVDIIPECTNLSVGYYNQHRSSESQDLGFALELLETVCTLDVDALVAERIPGTREDDRWARYYTPGMSGRRAYGSYDQTGRTSPYSRDPWQDHDEDYDLYDATFRTIVNDVNGGFPEPHDDTKPLGKVTRDRNDLEHLMDLVSQHPDAIAMMLQDYGLSADDVLSYIYNESAH